MTDHGRPDLWGRDPSDRAERAFARALSEHDRDHDFAPLDPETLILRAAAAGPATAPGPSAASARAHGVPPRDAGDEVTAPNSSDAAPGTTPPHPTPPGRRRPWHYALAAAVVLVLALPVGAFLLTGTAPRSVAPAAAPYETGDAAVPATGNAPGATHASASVPAAVPEKPTPFDASAVPDGWRWESMLDVSAAVPGEWGYDLAPGADWCTLEERARPSRPYVDRNPLSRGERGTQCAQPLPDSLRQTHLTWRYARSGDADGTVPVGAWRQVNRVVGSALLTVEVPAGQEALAQQILATAQVGEVDVRGCPVRRPAGAPTGEPVAARTSASEVAVCQYTSTAGGERPDLVGSYTLSGADAAAVWDAVRAAPVVTRTATPSCGPEGSWLLLRFDHGASEVRLQLASCGRFVLDDGTELRTPTRASCGDLLTGPLWVAGLDRAAAVCEPR